MVLRFVTTHKCVTGHLPPLCRAHAPGARLASTAAGRTRRNVATVVRVGFPTSPPVVRAVDVGNPRFRLAFAAMSLVVMSYAPGPATHTRCRGRRTAALRTQNNQTDRLSSDPGSAQCEPLNGHVDVPRTPTWHFFLVRPATATAWLGCNHSRRYPRPRGLHRRRQLRNGGRCRRRRRRRRHGGVRGTSTGTASVCSGNGCC